MEERGCHVQTGDLNRRKHKDRREILWEILANRNDGATMKTKIRGFVFGT
jgi:hypothetical protein